MLIRLIIIIMLIYLAVKLFKNLLVAPPPKSEIKGTPKKGKPLDLSNADIEDADFEEIDENK
jgi:hypothetical protein